MPLMGANKGVTYGQLFYPKSKEFTCHSRPANDAGAPLGTISVPHVLIEPLPLCLEAYQDQRATTMAKVCEHKAIKQRPDKSYNWSWITSPYLGIP